MNRDNVTDKANRLLEEIKPELLRLLKNVPDYGEVGLSVALHQGEISRISVKAEIAKKLLRRDGGVA